MRDGQKITFNGEGDQEPGLEPGDVMIVLDQKEHDVFQRKDDDLTMKMNIKLAEALCGFKKTIRTLDDRMLIISSHPGTGLGSAGLQRCLVCGQYLLFRLTERVFFLSTGEVIKHNDIRCVQNEGMPVYRDPYEKGQLIIRFEVSYTEHRTVHQCDRTLVLIRFLYFRENFHFS